MMTRESIDKLAGRRGPNLNIVLTCPECKVYPPKIVERFSEGDVVCALCGLVLSDKLVDTRSEWRTFSNDDHNGDDPSRVGEASNPLLDGNNLSTRIGKGETTDMRFTKELNKAQGKNVMDKKDNEVQAAFAKITMLCDAAELPKIVKDCAKEAYKLCHDEKTLKGKSMESIMAASILIGCRRAEVARTFKEIQSLIHVKTKEFGKTLNIMKNILRGKSEDGFLKIDTDNMSGAQNLTYIPRFCSHLGLPMQVTTSAEYTAKKCKEIKEIAGKSPITIAVVSIYLNILLFQIPITAAKVGQTLQVTEGTIKSGYKILYEHRDKLVDPQLIANGVVSLDNLPGVEKK
nr:YPR086W [Saccharomyces cerevisiae]